MTASRSLRLACGLMAAFLARGAICQGDDAPGSKDHPLFTRMKDFTISEYEVKDFDADEFSAPDGKDVTVEGRKYVIQYEIREGAKVPSPLQIIRNYGNAIRKIGGGIYEYADNTVFLSLRKDGKEVWAKVYAAGETYSLTVVEKGALAQEVTARNMLDALNRDGRIALQILFDTGKATIRRESAGIVEELASLLRENPGLRVGVEGHTDNVGSAPSNKALSEQRARAVVEAVAAKEIEPARMRAAGFGQDRPVADNKTEEGRARNRRVEIVKL